MIDVPGLTLTRNDRDILRHPLVGGVILFARNYDAVPQLEALISEIRDVRNPQLLVAVDQEGGRVQRFKRDFFNLAPLSQIGTIYMHDPAAALVYAEQHAWMMASELRAIGVDFSFAPVIDLFNPNSEVIGDRAIHNEPVVVAEIACRYLASLRSCGMVGVAKHFPGHGGVSEDSHICLPTDDRPFSELQGTDLLPYKKLIAANLEAIMMAHIMFPAIDTEIASLSEEWISQRLRQELRFDGIVFSDDLMMEGAAIGGSYTERARRALGAGCDVLLVCNHREAAQRVVRDLENWSELPTTRDLTTMKGKGPTLGLAGLRRSDSWKHAYAYLKASHP